jgi:hypothetical protein
MDLEQINHEFNKYEAVIIAQQQMILQEKCVFNVFICQCSRYEHDCPYPSKGGGVYDIPSHSIVTIEFPNSLGENYCIVKDKFIIYLRDLLLTFIRNNGSFKENHHKIFTIEHDYDNFYMVNIVEDHQKYSNESYSLYVLLLCDLLQAIFDPDLECIHYNLTENDNIIDFLTFTDNMNKTIYINKKSVHRLLQTHLQFIDTIKPYNIEQQFFMV